MHPQTLAHNSFVCDSGRVPRIASETLGLRLREVRHSRAVTLQTLAERSGVSTRTIKYIEGGGGNPRLDIIEALAQVLGVPVSELLTEGAAA